MSEGKCQHPNPNYFHIYLTKKIGCLKMEILTMKRISIWKELFSEREPGGVKLLTGHRRTYLGVTVRKNGADQRYGSFE